MNLKKIREILNMNIPEDYQEQLIIQVLSEDKNVIPTLLKILEIERKSKEDLLVDCNLLLSKANVGLEEPKFNKDGFMQKEIREFYKKNKGKIGLMMCLTAFLVGAIIGTVFPAPFCFFLSAIAGGAIGLSWNKIWSLFNEDE